MTTHTLTHTYTHADEWSDSGTEIERIVNGNGRATRRAQQMGIQFTMVYRSLYALKQSPHMFISYTSYTLQKSPRLISTTATFVESTLTLPVKYPIESHVKLE